MQGVTYCFSIFSNCHSRNTNLLSQLHLKFFCARCKYSYYCENYMQKARCTSQLFIEMLCEFGCWGGIWYFYHGKGMNGGILWGRPRPRRGCSAIYGWIMARFGIIFFQRHFWLKYMLPLQLYIYPFPPHLFF